jgi:nucleotide-binding universal stress UspA family protein
VSYSSIMVHLTPTASAFRRLALTVDLARRLDALMVGFTAVDTDEVGRTIAHLPHSFFEQRQRELELSATSLADRFAAETANLRTQWRAGFAAPVEFAAQNSRAADLVVVGRSAETEPHSGFELKPAPLLMTLGRPLLLVPPDVESLSADKIVVAWKSGRHARLAVREALPLLVRASQVTVVGVGDETGQEELDDVRAYLQLHGAKAVAEWRVAGERTVAGTVVHVASEKGADLIVCGGYGHSRLREWVLGGVTEDLLDFCPVCCLTAH